MAYTKEEIKTLWDNLELGTPYKDDVIYPVDTLLILIYTGMRPGELLGLENENINLEDRYITIVGSKTGERIIPIHEDIYPLIKKRKGEGYKYFVNHIEDKPLTLPVYLKFYFEPVMKKLNMPHSIHSSRKTFLELAKIYSPAENGNMQIMGFAVLNDKTPEELVKEINKIEFIEKEG